MWLGMKPENFQLGSSMRRAKAPAVKAIRYPDQWSRSLDERDQQWKDWRHIAMQVLQQNDCRAHRVLAILQDLFDWDKEEISATDEGFAAASGYCSTKTVQRDLKDLRRLGLIVSVPEWKDRGGKYVKGRTITLSLPESLDGVKLL